MGAYEINEEAIAVYRKHFPKHPQLGDVLKGDLFPKVDLIIGGCPCQAFSIFQRTRNGFNDERSEVFIGMIERLKKTRLAGRGPKHVLLENVVMKGEDVNRITKLLEDAVGRKVYVTQINSKYFSAQSRRRIYWSTFWIPQPWEGRLRTAPTLDAILETGKEHVEATMNLEGVCQKAGLEREAKELGLWGKPFSIYKSMSEGKRWAVHSENKARCVVANQGPFQRIHDGNIFRNHTVLEYERLQGLPEGYTGGVGLNSTTRFRLVGNSFQLDTIVYTLGYTKT